MLRRPSPLVGALLLAEVLIASTAVAVVSRMHHVRVLGGDVAFASEPATRRLDVATGAAPHVVVDDERSKITVDVWDQPRVAVEDHSVAGGLVVGKLIPLSIERSGSDIRIVRHGQQEIYSLGAIVLFGGVTLHVPRSATLDLHGEGADVRGLHGSVAVRGGDGAVRLTDVVGDVDVRNGDGSVTLQGIRATRISARTVDGSIRFAGRLASDGSSDFSSEDGRIALAVPGDADVTVRAKTQGGSITARDGIIFANAQDGERTATLGSGRGVLHVTTADGSITLTHYGAQSNDG